MTTPPHELTRPDVDKLHARMLTLLNRFAAETGLSVSICKGSYTKHNVSFTVETAVRGKGGVVMGRKAEAFLANAVKLGLRQDDLGRDFEHEGKWFRIIGFDSKLGHPVICAEVSSPTRADGLFQAKDVRHILECKGMRTRASPYASVMVAESGGGPDQQAAAP